ncbi:MAG: hypothetical protein N2039_05020 [Gemmataceae bacterium]|nr:hypothetical protein [Gemmataceae bacterium]
MTEQPEQREHTVPSSDAAAPPLASGASGMELLSCASNPSDFKQQLLNADVDTLASWAGHAPEEWQRQMAFEQLRPFINEIIRKLRYRCARRLRDDFEVNALAHIWGKVTKFTPHAGTFQKWCAVVLRHLALTMQRGEARHRCLISNFANSKLKSRPPHRKPLDDPDARPPLVEGMDSDEDQDDDIADPSSSKTDVPTLGVKQEHLDSLKTSMEDLRDALSSISWGALRGVNYHAVVLLQLRLAMAKLVTGTIEHVLRSEVLEAFLPWVDNEKHMSFRNGWPTLEAIWDGLCPRLDEPPNYVDVGVLCNVVNDLPPPTIRLNEALWNQWVKRAKERLKLELQAMNHWTPLLASLFPDRS